MYEITFLSYFWNYHLCLAWRSECQCFHQLAKFQTSVRYNYCVSSELLHTFFGIMSLTILVYDEIYIYALLLGLPKYIISGSQFFFVKSSEFSILWLICWGRILSVLVWSQQKHVLNQLWDLFYGLCLVLIFWFDDNNEFNYWYIHFT